VFPHFQEDSEEQTPCEFCGLIYCALHCVTTGARNVISNIMKFVLGPWAESSSYAEYARDSAA